MSALAVLGIVLGAIVALVMVAGVVIILGMRTGNRGFIRAFTSLQRRALNPRQLLTAGAAGAPWAVVRHRGRVTGKPYATPVGAIPDGDAFVIALPYGPEADWVRNVLAAEEAVLAVDGVEYRSTDVAVVPFAETALAKADRLAGALFGIRSALRLGALEPALSGA